MSYRIRCIGLRLGAHRSNVYDEYDLNMILDEILHSKFIKLSGVMGYEASVAGLPDDNPYGSSPNWIVRNIKPIFQKDCNLRRSELVDFIKNKIKAINDGTDGIYNYNNISDDDDDGNISINLKMVIPK